ncbi:MAG: nucleoside:proton symporter [Novosphingobium sp. 32-60-15]|uniref:NupC/NupG family nucleoside CNT transporter n=1 Tax=unclassified Novosphingobium TaxID=2644732 RepID=UPI000BD96532|nr:MULTISPECIES: nucleoside transporter C-terminal domain-containing protein [unclassified Novosphingobium]OYX64117.1 MAG: nucleoside:proton symporter [Novosphingobium sp. 32-60-15]
MAILQQAQGLIGIAVILGLAWAFSEDRKVLPGWRWAAGAIAMQLVLALVIVRVPAVWGLVDGINRAVAAIETATLAGSSYMFGYLGGAPIPFVLKPGAAQPMVIAFQILPLIIVFSALTALLWHWGVLRVVVNGLSWALRKTLGVTGVVGLNAGANIFLGVVEAPLIVRSWFARMSRADMFAVMVLSMANISGALLVLYATTLAPQLPDAVGHMIVASFLSLPAAILVARIMVPGVGSAEPEEPAAEVAYESTMDAIIKGTMDGVQLVLAVIGIIIVIFALVNLVDQILAAALPLIGIEPITVKRSFGWLFSPFMWTLGVPWAEAGTAGSLMGTKAILNEYVAYLEFAGLPAEALSARSKLIVTYALCNVANLASVGLLVSTISTLAPDRRRDAVSLGMKSWIAGNLASAMGAAVIGLVTPIAVSAAL